MKRVLCIAMMMLSVAGAYATHNRAGEITYRFIGDLSADPPILKYEITVTTYTKKSSESADRCELEIKFGDNTLDTIYRENGPTGSCGDDIGMGEDLGNDIKKNVYRTTHTYNGAGIYTISVEDPNRNANIQNIPESVQQPFYIESYIYINPFVGINSSPELEIPPIDDGCTDKVYYHNPGAVDPDGDSLSYSLIQCRGENGSIISGYEYPNETGNNSGGSLSVDPLTGTLEWDAPRVQGEYNVCILIEEYKDGVKVGSILRDMQITIVACDNNPPLIETEEEICAEAGDTLTVDVLAWDPDSDDVVLTASGEPLSLSDSSASFEEPVLPDDSVQGVFSWALNCNHVRNQTYQVVFRAEDSNDTTLVTYKTLRIKVVAPPPENPDAVPKGNSIELDWEAGACSNASCYQVYRRVDSLGFVPDSCQTGVPDSIGYALITTTDGSQTSYVDDNKGEGLIHGQQYCYLVVACFEDGTESYASEEFCTELTKDVPVITRVSVNSTNLSNGSDTITWSMPTELDTNTQFPGPYHYKIYRSEGMAGAENEIGQTAESNSLIQVDTFFVDSNLNTELNAYTYRVALFSGDDSVGTSHTASSVFLSSASSDNTLTLTWEEDVPWTNYAYWVYRKDENDQFVLLDTVYEPLYKDSGLVNLKEYCYYVKSVGEYSTSGFVKPLLNNSQEHCAAPVDTSAPCAPPGAMIDRSCENAENTLRWSNPNNVCTDDAISYNVYYSPFLGEEMNLLTTINSPEDTSFTHENLLESVAGCYAITAVDSFQNESSFTEFLCVDNCPVYILPKVFTPNNDGINEVFMPIEQKYIESVEVEIYNRWGQKVFETTDPDILWNGKNMFNNTFCSEGVYYYVCQVNEIRLEGITPRIIKGYVHLLRGTKPSGSFE